MGAGETRVVVGEHRTGGAFPEQPAVHPRDARDQTIGRGALDQLLEVPAAALCRDREASVLDEAPGIDEVGDVLAGSPAAGDVPPLDCITPTGVLGQRSAPEKLGKVVAELRHEAQDTFGEMSELTSAALPPIGDDDHVAGEGVEVIVYADFGC